MKQTRLLIFAAIALFSASALLGASYLVPSDRELVERADAIVIGTAGTQRSFQSEEAIYTAFTISVEEVLKGSVSLAEPLTVTELGGVVGERSHLVTGSPRYEMGERVLIFLERSDRGYRTWGMSLGKFGFVRSSEKGEYLLRGFEGEEIYGWDAVGKRHVEPLRSAEPFLRFVRETLQGDFKTPSYMVAGSLDRFESEKDSPVHPDVAPGPSAYLLQAGGRGTRWTNPSKVFETNGTQPGVSNTLGAVDAAMAIWNADGNSNVVLTRGVTTTEGVNGNGARNVIIFNVATISRPLCPGANVIGCTSIIAAGTHTFKGETLASMFDADIEIKSTINNQSQLQDLLAHELGHGIGLRHADASEGSPWATLALMEGNASGRPGSLRDWDKLALGTVYGTTICPTDTISSQPESEDIVEGQSVRLTVGIKNEAIYPITIQWYRGISGDTSSPVAGGTSNFINVSPTSTTSYWVQVTNGCSDTRSATAVVTVTECTSPSITTQPQPQTIISGQTATLSVVAAGTDLTYQWFEVIGALENPVTAVTSSPTYTTPPLTSPTRYFVRVTGCNTPVQSNTVLISIQGVCTAPVIATQPANVTVNNGQTATFTVGATGTAPLTYQWYLANSPSETNPVGANSSVFTTGPLSANTNVWVKVSNTCGFANSQTAIATVSDACVTPAAPQAFVAAQTFAGTEYDVTWPALGGVTTYELQEATNREFTTGVTTRQVIVTSSTFEHLNPIAFYYRLRGIATCNGSIGPYSPVVRIVNLLPPVPVVPPVTGIDIAVPVDTEEPVQYPFLLVPPEGLSNVTFTATTDQPAFMTISPSSGPLPPAGVVLTITANPAVLDEGTSFGSVQISFAHSKGDTIQTHTGTSVPTGVSVVTPVTPAPKEALPPDNTLLIPAVAHVQGQGAEFVSDVRITNTATQPIRYRLTFTPTGTNGTQVGNRTFITVNPNQTTALNDVVKQWYGFGLLNDGTSGVLEIRPENFPNKTDGTDALSTFATVGSSRTYAKTAGGTFGQFIPAVPFSQFVGKTTDVNRPTTLSLQQIAQSPIFRTNIGLVEAAGQPATVQLTVFNGQGVSLGVFTETLQASEHRQMNQYLSSKGITNLTDGRVEVRVTSDTGRITAYASVLDNATTDPLLVSPVRLSDVRANKYVLAGVADIKNGVANWRSDLRIFNSSTSPVSATLRFYAQGSPGTPIVRQITIPAGVVQAMDNVLETTFGVTNTAGAVHVETANQSSLVVTGRTYDQRPVGTYGQFIPAVTQTETTGLGERPLQVLQLEQSDRFRSNLGLSEVTGQPVTVQITAIVPTSTIAPVRTETLAANEFRQLNAVLQQMNLSPAYNARIIVRVIGGGGRVTAYGSVVDNLTQDPTYIPAQ